MSFADKYPPVAVRRRAGDLRTVELDGAERPLAVEFVIPDQLMVAEFETAAHAAMATIRDTPGFLRRYGLDREGQLTDQSILAMSRIATAVESAVLLWKQWNAADPDTGEVRPLEPEHISLVLGDPNVRAAWMIHLDQASPLERIEGNVSGASPSDTGDQAPTTAASASSSEAPAPAEGEAPPEPSAPA